MTKKLFYFFIYLIICILTVGCGYHKRITAAEVEKETFGAEANPTGDPIGGGNSYRRLVLKSDYHVNTAKELIKALKKAKTGQVVYVDDTAEIDLTGKKNIIISEGVTLASGRGWKESEGALLYSNEFETLPLFLVDGKNVHITGLRLRGPDPERRSGQMGELIKKGQYYSIPNSHAIYSTHSHIEVDNCELWGWSHAAIVLYPGASNAYIHHNYIHHNQRRGLGYGIVLNKANALIEANKFDWNRHHIAGTGRPGTSYEACYNIVGINANGGNFDMHGKKGIAGDRIHIHHNTFKATHVPAYWIRGCPANQSEIHHNWIYHNDINDALPQTKPDCNIYVYKNLVGKDRRLEEGTPPLDMSKYKD